MRWFVILALASGCRPAAVTPSTSEAKGCPAPPPSYRADVEPVLREKCFACHAGNGDAVDELDLSKFETVHAGRVALEGKVRARAMPPAGRPGLTDSERQTLLSWLGCQAPAN
jgi:uncharacterized membrane protein